MLDPRLEIKENLLTWNNEKNNDFLIAIATRKIEEKIILEFNEKIGDSIYKDIVSLFNEFFKQLEY